MVPEVGDVPLVLHVKAITGCRTEAAHVCVPAPLPSLPGKVCPAAAEPADRVMQTSRGRGRAAGGSAEWGLLAGPGPGWTCAMELGLRPGQSCADGRTGQRALGEGSAERGLGTGG